MKRLLLILFISFIFITNTAKAQWAPINLPGFSFIPYKIHFTTNNTGYLVSDFVIYKTIDQGNTWAISANAPLNQRPFQDVAFYNNSLQFSVTRSGNYMYRTSNGGSSWTLVLDIATKYYEELELAVAPDLFNVFAIGYDFVNKNTMIYRTQDAGTTWSIDTVYSASGPKEVQFSSSDTGYIAASNVNHGVIINTYDGGNNWQKQNVTNLDSLKGIHFVNNNLGYAVGTKLAGNAVEVAKTTDAGQTWTYQNVGGNNSFPLTSIHFTSADTGYVVGKGGRFAYTTDGGNNWNVLSNYFDADKVYFVNKDVGFIAGVGDLVKTTNGGFGTITTLNDRIAEQEKDGLFIYPNPASEVAHINSLEKGLLSLFTMDGKLVLSKPIDKRNSSLNVSQLPKGIYLITLETANGRMTKKLFVSDHK